MQEYRPGIKLDAPVIPTLSKEEVLHAESKGTTDSTNNMKSLTWTSLDFTHCVRSEKDEPLAFYFYEAFTVYLKEAGPSSPVRDSDPGLLCDSKRDEAARSGKPPSESMKFGEDLRRTRNMA